MKYYKIFDVMKRGEQFAERKMDILQSKKINFAPHGI